MKSNDSKGRILFSRNCSTLILKFEGFIQHPVSYSLNKFIDEVISLDSFDSIILDLSDLAYIDSTNLGLITKLTSFMGVKNNTKVIVFSPNESISLVLALLGFDKILEVIKNRPIIKADFTEIPLFESDDDLTVASVMLDAHSKLIDMNEDNKSKFFDVVNSLRSDIESKKISRENKD